MFVLVNSLGWDSQENAVQSLTLWHSWETAKDPKHPEGASAAPRVVATTAAHSGVLNRYGNDMAKVEALALDVSFGDLCTPEELDFDLKNDEGQGRFCANYDSKSNILRSNFGGLTSTEIVEKVLRPAMLKKEAALVPLVQRALYLNFELIGFNAMPIVEAGGYAHRNTLNSALNCEKCLMHRLGRRYGPSGAAHAAAATGVSGWLKEADFGAYHGWQGLAKDDRAVDAEGKYWIQGTEAQARAHCEDEAKFPSGSCHGFVYVRSGSWSCGAISWPDSVREGGCAKPGVAYFFKRTRIEQRDNLRDPPHSCSAFSVPPEPVTDYDKCGADVHTRMDTWWRYQPSGTPVLPLSPGHTSFAAAEVEAQAFCKRDCVSPSGGWYTYKPDAEKGLSLDGVQGLFPMLVEKAAQEQQLELTMIQALQEDAVEELMLEYYERLRRIGFGVITGGLWMKPVRYCRRGGKSCGQRSLLLHPNDDGPLRTAQVDWMEGRRAEGRSEQDEKLVQPCPQPCIYGACEAGVCKCWDRAYGADCSLLQPRSCNEHPGDGKPSDRPQKSLGMSLSGIYYWSLEWVFTDLFKTPSPWARRVPCYRLRVHV